MRFATFNLYQFVASGFYWHSRDEHSTYTPAEWEQKQHWVSNRLQEMAADVVGFQEVFSVTALQTLCAAVGYPYFVTVDTPRCHAEQADVFHTSVVALASRFPVVAVHPLEIAADLHHELPIPNDFCFSRRPICAEVEMPDLGRVTVYVLHLKSKRQASSGVQYEASVDWQQRVRDTLRQRSRGTIATLLQRGLEATLVYHAVSQRLAENPQQAIVVMGDFNDEQDSLPLEVLTMQERIHFLGNVAEENWPQGVKLYFNDYRLADTFRLAPNMRQRVRPFTHLHRGRGNVLDYILVSNALNPKNANALAEVSDYAVWNHHLAEDGVENRLQSDHGQVCVEFLPCTIPAELSRFHQKPAHTITNAADIATRQDFVEYAGGIYQSPLHFKQWQSEDKWKNFWAFFFDTEHGWVTSIYGTLPVSELYQKQRHSIEHIIPRDFLDRYLAQKGVPRHVRYGATVNPFNFAPSERGLNAKRSNFPFDFSDEHLIRPTQLELHPENYSGFNANHEWVIPSRNRGDIARAILYMLLIYEIDELYNQHLSTLIHWAKIDSPSAWELAYNNWIYTRLGIRNPFIDSPENALYLLDNKPLMQSLEVR